MNSYTVLITPAATLPITVAEMKLYLRVDSSEEDDLIQAYIEGATQLAEKFTRRSFKEATYETVFDMFYNEMKLDHSPVKEIVSIKYDSTLFSEDLTLSTNTYQAELGIEPALITIKDGQTWPTTFNKKAAVRIRYKSGYTTIPKSIIQAIKLIVADWYEKREDSPRMMIQASERILTQYRVFEF